MAWHLPKMTIFFAAKIRISSGFVVTKHMDLNKKVIMGIHSGFMKTKVVGIIRLTMVNYGVWWIS